MHAAWHASSYHNETTFAAAGRVFWALHVSKIHLQTRSTQKPTGEAYRTSPDSLTGRERIHCCRPRNPLPCCRISALNFNPSALRSALSMTQFLAPPLKLVLANLQCRDHPNTASGACRLKPWARQSGLEIATNQTNAKYKDTKWSLMTKEQQTSISVVSFHQTLLVCATWNQSKK